MITESDIDRSIRNSFRTRIRLGFFDGNGDCPYTGMGEEYINNEEHREICAKMAEESVVLLKNEKEALPILPGKTESLALIGPLADVWYKDWYCGIPPYSVTVLDGMKKHIRIRKSPAQAACPIFISSAAGNMQAWMKPPG